MVKAGKRHSSYNDTGLDKRTPLICYFSPLAKLKARRGLAYNSTKQACKQRQPKYLGVAPMPAMSSYDIQRAVRYEKLSFLSG
jgi:hypothetical protein